MTKEEFKKLASERCREIGVHYTKSAVNMVFDIFEKAFYSGLELGMSISSNNLQWIPVEERVPLAWMKVLCMMKSNGQIVSGYLYTKEDGKVYVSTDTDFHFEDYGGYEVSHWCPLIGKEE